MKPSIKRKTHIALLFTHPIQYHAPLIRKISKNTKFNVTAIFRTIFSTKEFYCPEFQTYIEWGIDMLEGYNYIVLPEIGKTNYITLLRPLNYGIFQILISGKYDAILVHGYSMPFHIIAVFFAKILGIKVFIRDDATMISRKRSNLNIVSKKLFFFFINIICDGFLSVGTLNKDYYLEHGISENKIFDVPWAVDNDFFQINAKRFRKVRLKKKRLLGLCLERPILLYTGKMTRDKGTIDLFYAYNKIINYINPKPYLLYVGDGETRSFLMRKTCDFELDNNIFFFGFKNQIELSLFYELCDIFVLPSHHETWGLVINEVMNFGKAVIVSDKVGCAIDLVKSGKNGFIYQSGNIEQLASVLKKLLLNSDLCNQFGQESYQIINDWSFESDINGITNAIENIFSKGVHN